jgi:hypothetical protein
VRFADRLHARHDESPPAQVPAYQVASLDRVTAAGDRSPFVQAALCDHVDAPDPWKSP